MFPIADAQATGQRAMRDLGPVFARWLPDNAELADDVDPGTIVEALTVSVGGLLSLRPTGPGDATRFTPVEVEQLVQLVIPAQAAEVDPDDQADMVQDFQAVWWQYLTFLGETGRWSGSEGDLETCLALVDVDGGGLAEALAAAAADVTPDEEDAALLVSFPVLAVQAVLTHVGDGLDVPDDEEIAPDDVTAILAAFEHPIDVTVDEDGEPTHLDEVPWLHQVVLSMIDLGIVELDEAETVMTRSAEAATWMDPTPEPRELRRALVGRFVLDDPSTLAGGFSVPEAVLPSLFAAAMSGHPLDERSLKDVVASVGDPGPAGMVEEAPAGMVEESPDGVEQGSAGVAAEGPIAAVAYEEVRARLTELSILDVVSETAPWTVVRGYWPAIAAGVAEGAGEFEGMLGGGELDEGLVDGIIDSFGLGDAQKQQIKNILGGL